MTFEHAIVTDVLRCVQYIVVYRPPPSAVNGFKTKDYLVEIDEFLSDVNMSANKIVAIGDFNLYVDVPTKSDVVTFMSILSSLNMSQHVVDPTRKQGHTLDLVLLKTVMCVNVSLLTIMLYILMRARRNHLLLAILKTIDMPSFINDLQLQLSQLDIDDTTITNFSYDSFEQILLNVLNKHAPATTHVRTVRPLSQWYNDEIKEACCIRQRLESGRSMTLMTLTLKPI